MRKEHQVASGSHWGSWQSRRPLGNAQREGTSDVFRSQGWLPLGWAQIQKEVRQRLGVASESLGCLRGRLSRKEEVSKRLCNRASSKRLCAPQKLPKTNF